jgi:hypothetical protein
MVLESKAEQIPLPSFDNLPPGSHPHIKTQILFKILDAKE